jgi:hypothetical protein
MLRQRRVGMRNSLTWLSWVCVALFVIMLVLIGAAAFRGYY